jgi:hypothetical protein
MLIAVAGPYSADTPEQRQRNLAAMNEAAAAVMNRGHIPVIGLNAALPVVECPGPDANQYEAIMAISLALVDKCEAIPIIGESAGANRERFWPSKAKGNEESKAYVSRRISKE